MGCALGSGALTVTNIDLANGMLINFYRPKVDKVQNNKLSAAALAALRAYFAAGDAPALGQLCAVAGKVARLDQAGMRQNRHQ